MKRDSIDFAKTDISKLFVKLFIPTLLGMLFTSLLNIADSATGLRTLIYAVVMTVLYFASYVIQQRWVFAPEKNK